MKKKLLVAVLAAGLVLPSVNALAQGDDVATSNPSEVAGLNGRGDVASVSPEAFPIGSSNNLTTSTSSLVLVRVKFDNGHTHPFELTDSGVIENVKNASEEDGNDYLGGAVMSQEVAVATGVVTQNKLDELVEGEVEAPANPEAPVASSEDMKKDDMNQPAGKKMLPKTSAVK